MQGIKKFGHDTFSSLKIRNYRLYFIGQGISLCGTWMQTVALGWLALTLSGSGTQLGFVLALQFTPLLIAAPWGGSIVDRLNKRRILYWTDRGDPPRGNTVNRTPIDGTLNQQIVLGHFMEGIGIALDFRGDRMFVTDLGGSIYSARLNGSKRRPIAIAQGSLSGIAYA